MSRHAIRFQCTVPAHLTRTPQVALEKTINAAVEHLNSLVPGATNRSFHPVYEERKTKLGTVWDLLVVMKFDFKGPLPPGIAALKTHAELMQQLRRNKGN
jgi:hypothetical protein